MDIITSITSITAWLASPVGKTLAIYVAGRLLKLWPKFFDGAIPAGTAGVNLLLTVLNLLAQAASGNQVGGLHFAALEAAQPTNVLLDIVIPQLIADGAYNWPRKIWKWLSEHGRKILH